MRVGFGFIISLALLGWGSGLRAETTKQALLRYFDNSLLVQSALKGDSPEVKAEVIKLRAELAELKSIGLWKGTNTLTPFPNVNFFHCSGKIGRRTCTVQISDGLVSFQKSPSSWRNEGVSLRFTGTSTGNSIAPNKEIYLSTYRGRNLRTGDVRNFRVLARGKGPNIAR